MARDHARINLTIWTDPDFRNLPPAAQHLYLTLWTAPELSYCGVHDWRPARMTGLSTGFTAEHIETVAACLESRHFLVIDRQTEECLIRSWARFDGIMKQPRMAVSFVHAYAATASQTIRQVLAYELGKIKDESPSLACWTDKRVTEILEHPAVSAKDLPEVADPFGDDFGPGLDMGLPQTQGEVWGSVCTPSTPAPSPAPNSEQNPSTDVAEEFADWYALYPRKKAKADALKAYKAARKKASAETILVGLRRLLPELNSVAETYRPYPASWLRSESWEDEPTNVTQLRTDDQGHPILPPLPGRSPWGN